MTKAKVQKKISNLKKIKEIIQISKFDTLQKLQKSIEISDTFLEMGMMAKELITFAEKQYKIKAHKIKGKQATLWILITPESELLSTSSAKFKNIIREEFNRDADMLVSLGQEAFDFSELEKDIRTIYKNDKVDSSVEGKVSSLISSLLITGKVSNVKFVLNSPKVGGHPINIFPINELNIDVKTDSIKVDSHYKFFPSLTQALNSLTNIYISRMTYGLIEEAKSFHLKEKLIKHEGAIKNVEERVKKMSMDLRKIARKDETEELILVTQIAKRGVGHE